MKRVFSATVPSNPPRAPIGYFDERINTYYWLCNLGAVRFFDTKEGSSGLAHEQDWGKYGDAPFTYTPIYEPFSINIGM